ncbi:unnamed protein product [Strongylus vulgaris]|uniref:Uncharacterized protein n=1 Tax=Strongylus vulgaris TaxID=40348 RepID=A0A3P7IPD5_STRVU|nr:unnamed protein product [Strongylus vulgaris]
MHDKLGEAKAYGNMGNVMKMKDKRQLSIAGELDDKVSLQSLWMILLYLYVVRLAHTSDY